MSTRYPNVTETARLAIQRTVSLTEKEKELFKKAFDTTANLEGGQTIAGSQTFTGAISVDDTTQSTSTTTGSIHTDGGLGVAKDVFIGGDVDITSSSPLLTMLNTGSNASHMTVTLNNSAGSLVVERPGANQGYAALRYAGNIGEVALNAVNGTELSMRHEGGATFAFQAGGVTKATLSGVTNDLAISAGNLVIGTSGKGIDFDPAGSGAAANLLDDYEEGTWTPTVDGLSTPGTYTVISSAGNRYTKVGRLVTCEMFLSFSAASGGVGSARVSGLPFAYQATSKFSGSMFTASLNTTSPTPLTISIVPLSASSSTSMVILESVDNAASNLTSISGFSTSTTVTAMISYYV